MKFPNFKSASSALAHAAAGVLLVCASSSFAQSVYHVDINTSALGGPSAPFSVDFQFIDGGTLGNNSVTISHFTYGGGSPTGGATLFGGVAGGLNFNNVSFDNSQFFQELFQAFTPGTTLSFNVALTGNVDAGSPDGFSVSILDNALGNVPTSGFGSQLMQIDVNGTAPQTFAGTGDFSGLTLSVAAIPEPQTYALMLAGLGLLGFAARRKQ